MIGPVRGLCLPLVLLAVPAVAPAGEGEKATAAQVAKLIEELGDDDAKVRDEACRQLEKLGEKARAALTAAVTKHPELEGRKRARLVLGRITAAKVAGLIKALGDDKADAREAAEKELFALAREKASSGDGQAARAALARAAAEHADSAVRARASQILERGNESRIRELIQDLRAGEADRRDAATRDLVQIGSPALPQLREAMRSGDLQLRQRVRALVRAISNKGKGKK